MSDLWPEDISVTKMRAPLTILKEQASFLGSRTKNLIIAKVERQQENQYFDEEILD